MDLPISDKELATIVSALRLGGDAPSILGSREALSQTATPTRNDVPTPA